MSVLECNCGARVDVSKVSERKRSFVCPRCGKTLETLQEFSEALSHRAGTCAYCQAGIFAGARTQACASCNQNYHLNCWNENGGCAVYGCERAPKRGKGELGEEWAQMEPCPSCGELIPVGLQRCHLCHEDLEHLRNRPSQSEESEKASNRKSIKMGFILLAIALIPVLSPILLIVVPVVMLRKRQELLEEPRALVLMVSACVVAALFTVLLVVTQL